MARWVRGLSHRLYSKRFASAFVTAFLPMHIEDALGDSVSRPEQHAYTASVRTIIYPSRSRSRRSV